MINPTHEQHPEFLSSLTGRYAVLVLGGGVAGSACAVHLARRGLSVVLVERSTHSRDRTGELGGPELYKRLATLGPRSHPPPFVAVPHLLSAWGTEVAEAQHYRFYRATSALSLADAGLDAWLLERARDAGVHVVQGCSVFRHEETPRGWTIGISRKGEMREIQADLIVEALGRGSRSPFQPEAFRRYVDRLVCISVLVPTPVGWGDAAFVESCPDGWWFATPIDGEKHFVGLFSDADLFAAIPLSSFLHRSLRSTKTFFACIDLQGCTTPFARDARTSIRSVLCRRRWIAIGDAAWALDPLSGDGVLRAIDDGEAAADVAMAAVELGDSGPLRERALQSLLEFEKALATRLRVYGQEGRWSDREFWVRRSLQDAHQDVPSG